MLLAIFTMGTASAFADDLMVITEKFSPASYPCEQGVCGFAADIVNEIQKKLGKDIKIQLMPWKRGYYYLSNKPNVLLFQTVYSQERADKFLWCGPVSVNRFSLFKSKFNKKKIPTIQAATQLRVGTYASDSQEQALKNAGFDSSNFSHMHGVETSSKNLALLLSDQIDLWITTKSIASKTIESMKEKCMVPDICEKIKNNDIDDILEPVFEMKKTFFYLAFSRGTNPDTVKEWQKALDEIKQSGVYEKIMKKYPYGESFITFEKPAL